MYLGLGDKSSNVLKVLRLGPRPIKIITSSSEFVVDVLKRFKNVENPRHRLYTITVLQRESMAKLKVELADRKSQEEKVTIKHFNDRPRIVNQKN
ncbi:hypothetical protein HHI36_017091 [Cryptolaemus montrouzieri]|uniref:Uncharacterized protein n=1 Tax=Cryptolaemus montrouzieri TaxID=559131 RepID=A0ABD2NM01_9CUCU